MEIYFKRDDKDEEFYRKYLADRLPGHIIDAHIHINLKEHVKEVKDETIRKDWALQCGYVLPIETAQEYGRILYPEQHVDLLALPFPLKEADMKANNEYVSQEFIAKNGHALMSLRPEWSPEYVEKTFVEGGFSGFKPYVSFAKNVAEEDIRIFDYMPHSHLEIADRLHAAVLIHLPRSERLADEDNIRDIKTIAGMYPNIKLVLAHMGRCFNLCYFEDGIRKLGDTVRNLYFDTTAVINPQVYKAAFQILKPEQIIFGTDQPILLWHGKREWTERTYINLCREDFLWNQHQYPEKEDEYTLFLYEQLKAILDAIDETGGSMSMKEQVFSKNAIRVYNLNRYAQDGD